MSDLLLMADDPEALMTAVKERKQILEELREKSEDVQYFRGLGVAFTAFVILAPFLIDMFGGDSYLQRHINEGLVVELIGILLGLTVAWYYDDKKKEYDREKDDLLKTKETLDLQEAIADALWCEFLGYKTVITEKEGKLQAFVYAAGTAFKGDADYPYTSDRRWKVFWPDAFRDLDSWSYRLELFMRM